MVFIFPRLLGGGGVLPYIYDGECAAGTLMAPPKNHISTIFPWLWGGGVLPYLYDGGGGGMFGWNVGGTP